MTLRSLFQSFLFIVFLYNSLVAQDNELQFINYGVKDGLCEPECSAITQDARGFYWISTMGGINRYDGVNFKSYYPSISLKEKPLLDNAKLYFETAPNKMLTILGNSKAFILESVSQEFKPISSLRNKVAVGFERIDDAHFFVFSVDTVFVMNNALQIVQAIVPKKSDANSVVLAKVLDESHYLLNVGQKMWVFNTKTKHQKLLITDLPKDGLFSTSYDIRYIDQKRKFIYVSNFFKGLFQLDYSGKLIKSWTGAAKSNPFTGYVTCIIPDGINSGYLWIGTNHGLIRMNPFSNQHAVFQQRDRSEFSIRSNQISSLFTDKMGNLWVTTNDGLSVINQNTRIISHWNVGFSSDVPLMNMCRISPNQLLATKYYQTVYLIDEQKNSLVEFNKTWWNNSWFVFEDHGVVIHGGSGTTLHSFNTKTQKHQNWTFLDPFFAKSTLVTMGFKDLMGNWWFSGNGGGGLVKYNPKTKESQHFSKGKGTFSSSYFTAYSISANGDIWFSCNKSLTLTHWIQAENRFEEIQFKDYFETAHQSVIQSLVVDKKGNVWIGFEGSGLGCYLVREKKFVQYGKEHGIYSNYIFNLSFDHRDRLWIGTKRGLYCLLPDLKTTYSFGVKNGFPSATFDQTSYFDKKTSRLWIANSDYLLRFNPDELLKTKRPQLRVFIDELIVSTKKQQLGTHSNYYFKPTENTIQIVFSALNAINKDQVEFSYQLEGGSSRWIHIGSNYSVIFPNSSSGKYVFHLRARIMGESDWVYLKEPIRFEIETPWFKMWWFRILVLLLVATLLIVFTRQYYLRKIEKQQAALEKQRAVQDERDRIAYDMHDDLGSGLTKISYLSKEALRKHENEAELQRISATSLELVENMSELIWAMKVENDSLFDLTSYFRYYAVDYLEENSIVVHFTSSEMEVDCIVSGEIRRQLFLIFKEALHNIVKHAQTEKVDIHIEQIRNQLVLSIRDFGKGFIDTEKQRLTSGNGLITMQTRTERLKGEMEIIHYEQGIGIRLVIPLGE